MGDAARRVLITNASYHSALAAARSLGQRGYWVACAAKRRPWGAAWASPTFASRFCRARLLYPDPLSDPAGFVDRLADATRVLRCGVLLPVGVDAVLATMGHVDRLDAAVRVPFPALGVVERAHEKGRCLELASKLGIPIPQTFSPRSLDEMEAASEALTYPAVVKPRRGAAARGVSYVESQAALRSLYRRLVRAFPSSSPGRTAILDRSWPLIQEYVPGATHDVCLIARRGTLLGALTQERLRTYPERGGSGIVNRTTRRPELVEFAQRLVGALGWHGVAQVEFKRDERTGAFKLMEFNPKFWGTLALSIAAGIDFPHLACKLASAEEIAPAELEYRVGVVYRWRFPMEMMALAASGTRPIRLAAGERAVSDWRFSDPLPGIVQIAQTPIRMSMAFRSLRSLRVPRHREAGERPER